MTTSKQYSAISDKVYKSAMEKNQIRIELVKFFMKILSIKKVKNIKPSRPLTPTILEIVMVTTPMVFKIWPLHQ